HWVRGATRCAGAAGFAGRPRSDRDGPRAASRHRGKLTLHLDEMLAADGSTEVTEEQEDRRLLAPEVREADDAAVARRERGVRSSLADGDHRSAIALRTPNGKRRQAIGRRGEFSAISWPGRTRGYRRP